MDELTRLGNEYTESLKRYNETKVVDFSEEELKILKRIAERNGTINWSDFHGHKRRAVRNKLQELKL
jgi:hypothetical protein